MNNATLFVHVGMTSKAPKHTASGSSSSSASVALKAQIELSRTRMLIGHIPRASLTVGVFALIIVALVSATVPNASAAPMLTWLFAAVALSLLRTGHAIAYLRSSHRQAHHWQPTFLLITTVFGLCWAALPWMLPLEQQDALASTIIGAMIGMAATGAAMLGFNRFHTRVWIVPMLTSAALYCVKIGGPLGWFGVVSVGGFLVILWLESDRAHRRIGEMLRLRFESEELAKARAQALQEAESLSEAKSRFLATMSHEMRTPLHGMLGLSHMLRSELQSSTAHAQMSLLQNAGEQLLGVINDVLDFSRLKENKLELKPRPTDLQALVNGVCELADATARDKGVVVTMQSHLPPDLWVHIDPARLRQILTNLVGNAVKFTHSGHVIVTLTLAETSDDDHAVVTFEVEDTGTGIAADAVDKIFDAFHQADTRDERQGGTGLGLSIAQQICMAMQGEIRCESRVGIGSVFWFALSMRRLPTPAQPASPALPVLPDPATTDAPEPTSALQGMVLVAEDNPVNALVVQTMLEQSGLQVHIVENGQLALTWLAHHRADLILMDCHMPEMGGIEATRRIRALEAQQGAPAAPIIAVSAGKAHSDDHRQCLAVGMNDYLSKPFHRDDLVRVLQRHLQRGAGAVPSEARSKAPSLAATTTQASSSDAPAVVPH